MLFFATFVNYFTRVNVNMAILEMGPEFGYTESQKGLIKGGFYAGYFFLQIPGGRMAELYGSKRVLLYSTLTSAVITLITPLMAPWGFALIASRFLLGFAQGKPFNK